MRLAVGVVLAMLAATLTFAARPASADDPLTPAAAITVKLADRIPRDEQKRLVKAYRQARTETPAQPQASLRSAITAPPVCRHAFPPGVARNICAQMLAKIKTGGEATLKCGLGVVAVVARPTPKTVALLARNCGPPAAALAIGYVTVYLSKHCKAIMPWFLDVSCDLVF
jgi:hypothetical protein